MKKQIKLTEDHFPWLDGLRGGAASWVLLSHIQILTGLKAYPILSWGGLAVDLFMILSGFLMAHHYIQRKETEPWNSPKTVISFWLKRLFRIAPLYYVILALAFLLGPLLGEYRSSIALVWADTATPIVRYTDQSVVNVFTHVSFMFGFLPHYSFRSPLPDWSIGLEMQFYLAFPLIMMAMYRLGPIKASLLMVFVCVTLRLLFPGFFHQFEMPSFLPIKLYVFLIGIWIAVSRDQSSMRMGFFVALLIAILWIIIEKTPLSIARAFLVVGMFYLMGNGTLPCSNFFKNIIDRLRVILSGSISRFLGETSYASYLLHLIIIIPVAGMLARIPQYLALNSGFRFALCILISMPIIYLISWLLYQSVEIRGIRAGKLFLQYVKNRSLTTTLL